MVVLLVFNDFSPENWAMYFATTNHLQNQVFKSKCGQNILLSHRERIHLTLIFVWGVWNRLSTPLVSHGCVLSSDFDFIRKEKRYRFFVTSWLRKSKCCIQRFLSCFRPMVVLLVFNDFRAQDRTMDFSIPNHCQDKILERIRGQKNGRSFWFFSHLLGDVRGEPHHRICGGSTDLDLVPHTWNNGFLDTSRNFK